MQIDDLLALWRPYHIINLKGSIKYDRCPVTVATTAEFFSLKDSLSMGSFDAMVINDVEKDYLFYFLSLFFNKTFKNSICIISSTIEGADEIIRYFSHHYKEIYYGDDFTVVCRIPYGFNSLEELIKEISTHTECATAVCPTYKRPNLLAETIVSFMEQTYRNKKMYVLNDDWGGSIVMPFENNNIYVKNQNERFNWLCDKFEHMRQWAEGDVFFCWSDDDLYFPWRMTRAMHDHKKHHEFCIKHNFALVQSNGQINVACNNFEGTVSYKKEHFKNIPYDKLDNLTYELKYLSKTTLHNYNPEPYYGLLMRWSGVNYHVSGHGGTEESYKSYASYKCDYPEALYLPPSYEIWKNMFYNNMIIEPRGTKLLEMLGPWLCSF